MRDILEPYAELPSFAPLTETRTESTETTRARPSFFDRTTDHTAAPPGVRAAPGPEVLADAADIIIATVLSSAVIYAFWAAATIPHAVGRHG